MSQVFRKQLTVDADRAIHLIVPPDLGNEIEVIVLPRGSSAITPVSGLMPNSGFALDVLNNAEEECWNDL